MVDHLRRKGKEAEAKSLQRSRVSYSNNEDSQLTEDLTNAAKGRIITNG